MIASMSPEIRRILAIAILVLLPVLAWVVVVSPLAGMVTDRQADIAAARQRLGDLQAIIARIPGLKRRDEALKARLSEENGIWEETSEASVSAKMEEVLRGAVDAGRGTVVSSAPLRSTTEQEFRVVKVRFKIDGTLDTIEQTFAGIEAARPAIFVDSFTITAPAVEPPPDEPPKLDLDLEVMGYLRMTGP